MPARVTMRWPNGGSASRATSGGSSRTTSQKGDRRMSGPPADGFAEQALRSERQNHEHTDIERGGRPGVAEARRDKGLEDTNPQGSQQRARHTAPATERDGDIGLQHMAGALGRRHQELMAQQEARDSCQRA